MLSLACDSLGQHRDYRKSFSPHVISLSCIVFVLILYRRVQVKSICISLLLMYTFLLQ